jgi:hypothetical protein
MWLRLRFNVTKIRLYSVFKSPVLPLDTERRDSFKSLKSKF